MQRILMTGGTGLIGRPLADALRARGDEVTVVSRRTQPPAVGWGDIEREVGRADAVIHLAGEPIADRRWTDDHLARVRASRVDTAARIARAIQSASRKPRVLLCASGVSFYGMRDDDEVLDETAPPGDDSLARLVVDWENASAPAEVVGVRVVHARIGIVLAQGGGALARMAPLFRWFVGGPLGSGRQWWSWCHLRDVVRALLFALDHDVLAGPVNVVAPAPVTMETFANALARTLRRPAAMRVPAFALEIAVGRGLARMLLTGQRVIPQKLVDAGFAFEFPEVGAACADLLSAR